MNGVRATVDRAGGLLPEHHVIQYALIARIEELRDVEPRRGSVHTTSSVEIVTRRAAPRCATYCPVLKVNAGSGGRGIERRPYACAASKYRSGMSTRAAAFPRCTTKSASNFSSASITRPTKDDVRVEHQKSHGARVSKSGSSLMNPQPNDRCSASARARTFHVSSISRVSKAPLASSFSRKIGMSGIPSSHARHADAREAKVSAVCGNVDAIDAATSLATPDGARRRFRKPASSEKSRASRHCQCARCDPGAGAASMLADRVRPIAAAPSVERTAPCTETGITIASSGMPRESKRGKSGRLRLDDDESQSFAAEVGGDLFDARENEKICAAHERRVSSRQPSTRTRSSMPSHSRALSNRLFQRTRSSEHR